MERQPNNNRELGDLKSKVKIIFSSILGALLLLVDIYLMINAPENYIAIALFSVLVLGDLYFLVNSIIEVNFHREAARMEQYDGIYKAEKASYMIFRKYFDTLADKLSSMDDKLEMPAEEIISAQKAVAKVTINRSKENTDALMNSNDKLIEKLFEFEGLLSENNEKLLEKQADLSSQSNKDYELKQQELASSIREMELSIKNELYQAINQIALSQPQVVVTQQANGPQGQPSTMTKMPEPQFIEPPVFEEVAPKYDELMPESLETSVSESMPEEESFEEPMAEVMQEEPIIEEMAMEEPAVEITAEEHVMEEVEPILEQAPAVEEIPPMPDLSDPNKQMSADDIAALFANMAPVESAPIPEPEPEPVVEEIPPMPDLSDPNKQMSADDIAALFANMAPVESVPIPEPEPIVEEKPPMPDLSDPNKVMSPEEIQALFANM